MHQIETPRIPHKPEQEYLATGTDDCSQNCDHFEHETVQNSATQREVHGRNSVSPEKDKPRTSARLSDSKRVSSVKRVSGFEPPTFTLAT